MSEHRCDGPGEADLGDEWKCPDCGREWFASEIDWESGAFEWVPTDGGEAT